MYIKHSERYRRSVLDLNTIIYNDEENSVHIVDLFQTERGRKKEIVTIYIRYVFQYQLYYMSGTFN